MLYNAAILLFKLSSFALIFTATITVHSIVASQHQRAIYRSFISDTTENTHKKTPWSFCNTRTQYSRYVFGVFLWLVLRPVDLLYTTLHQLALQYACLKLRISGPALDINARNLCTLITFLGVSLSASYLCLLTVRIWRWLPKRMKRMALDRLRPHALLPDPLTWTPNSNGSRS